MTAEISSTAEADTARVFVLRTSRTTCNQSTNFHSRQNERNPVKSYKKCSAVKVETASSNTPQSLPLYSPNNQSCVSPSSLSSLRFLQPCTRQGPPITNSPPRPQSTTALRRTSLAPAIRLLAVVVSSAMSLQTNAFLTRRADTGNVQVTVIMQGSYTFGRSAHCTTHRTCGWGVLCSLCLLNIT